MENWYLELVMQLSRSWGKPSWQVEQDLNTEEEVMRQVAYNRLVPIPDSWLQLCILLQSLDCSKNPKSAKDRYPGDRYQLEKKKSGRKEHLRRVAAILNSKKEKDA